MTASDIMVLRNDLAALKSDVCDLAHKIDSMMGALSGAHVELQNNVKRIVDTATKRIDRLPCMAARRPKWKPTSK